jgi:hypothetical protein
VGAEVVPRVDLAADDPQAIRVDCRRARRRAAGRLRDPAGPVAKYTIATKGASDTLLALFEEIGGQPRYLAADDDSGEDRNASITYKLFKGRTYHVRLRLYYPGQSGTTALMYS